MLNNKSRVAKSGQITHGDPFTLNVDPSFALQKGLTCKYTVAQAEIETENQSERKKKKRVYYALACEDVLSN